MSPDYNRYHYQDLIASYLTRTRPSGRLHSIDIAMSIQWDKDLRAVADAAEAAWHEFDRTRFIGIANGTTYGTIR